MHVLLLLMIGTLSSPAQDISETRRAITAQYARMDALVVHRKRKKLSDFYTADARVTNLGGSESTPGGEIEFLNGAKKVFSKSSVQSISETGDTATVTVRMVWTAVVERKPGRNGSIRMEVWLRDSWQPTGAGWRIGRSEALRGRMWVDGRLIADKKIEPWQGAAGRKSLVEALRGAAIPLLPPDTEGGLSDLAGLDPLLKGARIVGLGEGSHGAHTLEALNHRLARYLVVKHGFTVIALETCWVDPSPVEHFVLTGEGDAESAVHAMYGEWATEDDVQLVLWVREHNAHRGSGPPVVITSTDLLSINYSLERLRRYAGRMRPEHRLPLLRLLAGSARWTMTGNARMRRQRRQTEKLIAWLNSRRDTLVAGAGAEAFCRARHDARLLWQVFDAQAGVFWPERDRAMAENLKWLAEEGWPGRKIVVLAHNGHVGLLPINRGSSMGEHLRNRYGSQYIIIGTTFYDGQIRVRRVGTKGYTGDEAVALPVPAAGRETAEALFHELDLPCFALDLRHTCRDDLPGKWLHTPQILRFIGASYNPKRDEQYRELIRMPLVYDALVFVSRTTAEKPFRKRP